MNGSSPRNMALVLLLGLALNSLVAAEKATAPAGVFAEVIGSVEVLPLSSDSWQPALRGMELAAGDQVRTGKKARTLVKMGNDIELRLGPNTTVEIELPEQTDKPHRSVGLFLGVLSAKVTHEVGEETPFEVYSSNAVAGVRGTEFTAAVGLDGSLGATVTEGRVILENETGSVQLAAGQYSQTQDDLTLTEPSVDPGTDWDAWLDVRSEKVRKQANEWGERWLAQSTELRGKLDDLVKRERQLVEEFDHLAQKARLARHSGQQSVQEKIRKRMGKLVAESFQIRSGIRALDVGLSSRVYRMQQLVADQGVSGAVNVAGSTKGETTVENRSSVSNSMADNARTLLKGLRTLKRELNLNLAQHTLRERRLLREFNLRYKDFLHKLNFQIRSLPSKLKPGNP